jgi:hypothetical protein
MDKEGNEFHRAIAAKAKPFEEERVAAEPNRDLTTLLEASLKKVEQHNPPDSFQQAAGDNHQKRPIKGGRRRNVAILSKIPVNGKLPSSAESDTEFAVRPTIRAILRI